MSTHRNFSWIFIWIVFYAFLFSCSNSNKESKVIISIPQGQSPNIPEISSDKVITSDILVDNKSLSLSTKIFYDVSYTILETNKASIIGSIDKVIVDGEYIFILDRTLSSTLFMFSKNGKYITKITKIGEGPNEIIQPYDFDVDRKNKQVIVYDGILGKFVFFNYQLNPIREKKIFPRFNNFRKTLRNEYILNVEGIDNSFFRKYLTIKF